MRTLLTLLGMASLVATGNLAQAEGTAGTATPAAEAQQMAPDDTGRNREREQGKAEADDQSNQAGDLELTARLRRAITDDDTLSVNAHNIKIVSRGGKVTLRGPVDSPDEKRKVEALARKAAAGRAVTSELEVVPPSR